MSRIIHGKEQHKNSRYKRYCAKRRAVEARRREYARRTPKVLPVERMGELALWNIGIIGMLIITLVPCLVALAYMVV